LAVIEGLLSKRQSRTPEETALFMVLVKLVEDYEREHYSIDDGIQVAPHKFLQHMMEARGMDPKDLMKILNISEDIALLTIAGEKQIDRSQSLVLGDYFNVKPINFYDRELSSETQLP
jgi:HTH-type transcriptional regulator / antitoxin HigA